MEHGSKTRPFETFDTNIDAQNGIQIHEEGDGNCLDSLKRIYCLEKLPEVLIMDTSLGDTKVNQETSR